MNRAPHILTLDCPGSGRRLAFGLRWLALIGSNVPALARARGRRLRATHLVVGGSPATMAGFGRMRQAWTPGVGSNSGSGSVRKRQELDLYSAAQLYALLYPSAGHCLIPLPDGRYWLVAAQDGMVLSQADRLFASREDALRAQARLLDQRPGMQEHDASLVWAALQQQADPAARLASVPSRWRELPPALRWFAVCVVVSAAMPPLWNGLTQHRVATPPDTSPSVEAPADALASWRATLASLRAHADSEIVNLLQGVGQLPVQVEGWALRQAQCDIRAQGWECSAHYARAHPLATNLRLHDALPPGWRLSFKPLDEATLHWRLSSALLPLTDVALPSGVRVDTELVGELQRLQPAFASVTLTPAVLVPSPGVMAADSVGAMPAALPVIRRRALRLHGPLRSFALLPGPLEAVRWSYLALRVQAAHPPTLVASTLVAELHGELYEQD